MPVAIPEPWNGFLREVDAALDASVSVHCLGGFVLMAVWGHPRPTGDLDVVEIKPGETDRLLDVAGEGSKLSKKYKLRFHRVTIAQYPEGYASRLSEVTPPGLRWLRLLAFEAHDLALAKLSRNSQRDREDVRFLVHKGVLDRHTLKDRFDSELRPYALDEARDTQALELWLEELFPVGS